MSLALRGSGDVMRPGIHSRQEREAGIRRGKRQEVHRFRERERGACCHLRHAAPRPRLPLKQSAEEDRVD